MTMHGKYRLILSIYATTRGFAFTLFEGALSPVDWGTKEYRGAEKNARCVEAIGKLLNRYHPDALVIENRHDAQWRRTDRIARLYQAMETLAVGGAVSVCRYDRAQLRCCFEKLGARTKQERASLIGNQIPAFTYKIPPPRRLWMSVHPRMGLFEAAALALTHYCTESDPGGQT